jgi:hypothetical protein
MQLAAFFFLLLFDLPLLLELSLDLRLFDAFLFVALLLQFELTFPF